MNLALWIETLLKNYLKPLAKRPYLKKVSESRQIASEKANIPFPIRISFETPYGLVALRVVQAEILQGKEALERWTFEVKNKRSL